MNNHNSSTVLDICAICEKRTTLLSHLSLQVNEVMDLKSSIELDIRSVIPYGSHDKGVCEECLKKTLQEWISA